MRSSSDAAPFPCTTPSTVTCVMAVSFMIAVPSSSAAPLAGGLSPVPRTPRPRSDTPRSSSEDFLVRRRHAIRQRDRIGLTAPTSSCARRRGRALWGLAQPLLGVLGQEIAQRDATAPGLGREPSGKVTGKDDGAVHAVVALPPLVTQFGHAPLLSDISAAASLTATWRRRMRSLSRPRQLRFGNPGPCASPAMTGRGRGGGRPDTD